jgi:cation:H+ antiporter
MEFEMNMYWAVPGLIAGLLILIKGADFLVDGAVALAEKLGVSPLVIGLTIVAMGTSAPEVAASVTAAVRNLGNLAIGNVYGSNIANLALVGGVCALIRPLKVVVRVQRRELPVMLIVGLLLYPFLYDLFLSRFESVILLSIFLALIVFTVISAIFESKSQPDTVKQVSEHIHEVSSGKDKPISRSIVYILLGLIALAGGAHLTLESAVFIGQQAGLSKTVIGLTIVAIVTSLPELITCVVAALKGHDDISIGNLVGSNVFNTLLVIGTAGSIKPFVTSARLIGVDYWTMIAVSVAFMLIAIFRKRISRISGMFLLTVYIGYMVYVLVFTPGV